MTTTKEEYEERRATFVKALRSGDYTQVKHALARFSLITRKVEGFCCLGVAANLVKPWATCPIYKMSHTQTESGSIIFGELQNCTAKAGEEITYCPTGGATGILPRDVADYYGFKEGSGTFYITDELVEQFPKLKQIERRDGEHCDLTVLNDSFGWTFAEIADLIEAEPKGLFVS